ncbi:MAG TPA: hypothetical protein VGV59_13660 [Pyrinomonadaceae bacterium]|nr:hypothetical protein [Pyrinomonadaceae bacterium]
MFIERNRSERPRRATRSLIFVAASLLLSFAGAAFAQDAPPASSEQELTVTDVLKMPGRVVGQGSNAAPRGLLKLRSYRVEEVQLPRFTEVEVRGRRVAVDKAFRVSITGGPFHVRALPAVIWVDDVALGYGIESEDLNEITVVTYDAEALREGASLYLSYGDKENKKERTALPETLKFDAKGANR